jgi:hypothetical protein
MLTAVLSLPAEAFLAVVISIVVGTAKADQQPAGQPQACREAAQNGVCEVVRHPSSSLSLSLAGTAPLTIHSRGTMSPKKVRNRPNKVILDQICTTKARSAMCVELAFGEDGGTATNARFMCVNNK